MYAPCTLLCSEEFAGIIYLASLMNLINLMQCGRHYLCVESKLEVYPGEARAPPLSHGTLPGLPLKGVLESLLHQNLCTLMFRSAFGSWLQKESRVLGSDSEEFRAMRVHQSIRISERFSRKRFHKSFQRAAEERLHVKNMENIKTSKWKM